MVIMGALILVAITSFSVPEGLVKKLPADVVQTFRSAQHGRPEGLHSNNLLARAGDRAASQNAVHSNATLTAVPGIKVGHQTLAAPA